MEVIASFFGGDLSDSANKSVQHLKRYLQSAQHGPVIFQTEAADPDAVPESPFEEEVIAVLRGWGYDVQPQVGVAGFRIGMAVRHPGAPGAYALGIECDGAMYHSSRAARYPDRPRESVLRDLGWRLHLGHRLVSEPAGCDGTAAGHGGGGVFGGSACGASPVTRGDGRQRWRSRQR
ncbi:hypothetical protein [Streptomyces sp. NPDC047990]|uniref:hypothetical protein n=1 Tax=Streptomyces sp. NPDC047990 TaxID=3365496 RepID=UPI0037207A6D